MTFQLQPGDYIRTESVPDDKKQAVIDAFVKAGADREIEDEILWSCDFIGWWIYRNNQKTNLNASNGGTMGGFEREVTLDQILGKPMLIEAAQSSPDGTRFKLVGGIAPGQVVKKHMGKICYDDRPEFILTHISALTTTDYEIIPADPVPWVPSEGDYGWYVSQNYHVNKADCCYWAHFRTREGAEQGAKIMKVINAICNMPGYGGNGAIAAWSGSDYKAYIVVSKDYVFDLLDFPFDTMENAKSAANHANKLIKEMGE